MSVVGSVLRRAGRLVGARTRYFAWSPSEGGRVVGSRSLGSSGQALYADLQVSVPALGESITDGAIAAIMKQPGDSVEEDEALLSIETDKVTVDVRAPVSGVLKSILVSLDDSVEVGRVVAVVSEGEGRGTVESAPERAVEERRETLTEMGSAPVASEQDVIAAGRSMERVFASPPASREDHAVSGVPRGNHQDRAHVPLISFPTRRTADGRMISEMSKDDQKRIRNEELSALHSASFFLRNRDVRGSAPAPPVWRRPMSDREMEAIMLGGAE